jgi:hypothetical protein
MFNPWECPRCHTIYSPYVPQCHCKPQTTSTGTGTGNELAYGIGITFPQASRKCLECGGFHGGGLQCKNL